jgi:hypothetical protein
MNGVKNTKKMQKIKLLLPYEAVVSINTINKTTPSSEGVVFVDIKKPIKKYRTHASISVYESSPPATTHFPSLSLL